jgi:hypothetical protein
MSGLHAAEVNFLLCLVHDDANRPCTTSTQAHRNRLLSTSIHLSGIRTSTRRFGGVETT